MKKEKLQNQTPETLELQDDNKFLIVPVESSKKRRRNCLIVVLTLLVITLIVAIVVPLVLFNKADEPTSDVKPKTSNSSAPATTGITVKTTQPYTGWNNWGACTVTCGNGTRQRKRKCASCNVTIETSQCQMAACWEEWGQWSPCSKTCSVGNQFRSRNCSESERKCDGNGREARNCTLTQLCPAKDCSDWRRLGKTNNGVYRVDPDGLGSFTVYCDMTTDGGGWTVFQRRQNGSVQEDFYLKWEEYKTGFGNLTGEFWLGNDKIHRLTSAQNTSLLIDIEDWKGGHYNASYLVFEVASENSSYTLTVSQYSGNAGDSLAGHNGMNFTTKDRDNDKEKYSNCAVGYRGGWWFNKCVKVNLNGKYVGNRQDRQGIIWLKLSTLSWQSMKATEMKLRPRP